MQIFCNFNDCHTWNQPYVNFHYSNRTQVKENNLLSPTVRRRPFSVFLFQLYFALQTSPYHFSWKAVKEMYNFTYPHKMTESLHLIPNSLISALCEAST